MATLLTELLHDAIQRVDDIVQSLEAIKSQGSAEVDAYRDKMKGLATHARNLINGLLSDPDIDDAKYALNYFREYCHFARLLRGLEDLPLLVLKRFSESDQIATDVMTAICKESGYPYSPPICSAISSQYFWTMPDMDLVFIPCLEPDHVLGLPDIYHELGHILLFREESSLVHPAYRIVDDYYDQLKAEGKRLNWPLASLEQVEKYQHNWRSSWLLEFASDLIATFLVGPSFGWCNIRTATNLGGELFVGTDSHPADDARATARAIARSWVVCKDGVVGCWTSIEDQSRQPARFRGFRHDVCCYHQRSLRVAHRSADERVDVSADQHCHDGAVRGGLWRRRFCGDRWLGRQ